MTEARVVELEWPARLRLGDSDSVRLALIPSEAGYVVTTEFPENQVLTQTVNVIRPDGYELFGVAALSGVGFDIAPEAEQIARLPAGEPVTWRWTLTPRAPGQHRLTVNLWLRWQGPQMRESQLYSRSLTLQVTSFLGLTTGQALWVGLLGLVIGGGVSVAALTFRLRPRAALRARNPALSVEPPPDLALSQPEHYLLQSVFRQYARAVVETEFRSGYSGARALLVRPIHADGRADAHTIVKIGSRPSLEREFGNYQRFVKDSLPPITARVQDELVFGQSESGEIAALRYTFIAEPGKRPISLGEALRQAPDPALLTKLFETFGPQWWLQRRAHTFRWAQEYDRLLPAHYVLEPLPRDRIHRLKDVTLLKESTAPAALNLKVDAVVSVVERFAQTEPRQDGRSLTLVGRAQPGQPPLRLRWQSPEPPLGHARVIATRETLLREWVAGLDLFGLPDPLLRLPEWLTATVVGSQSIIHGDLNLENVLVGPGGFVWLIDFAQTGLGHPLLDFAHLEAEIIAHIIAPQLAGPEDYLALWATATTRPLEPQANLQSILATLHQLASRCLADATRPSEYQHALALACLGALKYPRLDRRAKHLLYLTAAYIAHDLRADR